MGYFANVTNTDQLKAKYRKLAKKNHPDAGGDAEVMTAINAEYKNLLQRFQNGDMAVCFQLVEVTAVAKEVRRFLQEQFPGYKFTVRSSNRYSRLTISLVEGRNIFKGTNPCIGNIPDAGDWYIRYSFTEPACEMFAKVNSFVNSYAKYGRRRDPYDVNFIYSGVHVDHAYRVK